MLRSRPARPDAAARPDRALLLAVLLASLAAAPLAGAQGVGSTWVALDTSPAGTPAQLTLDVSQSTPSVSVIHLVISGFWMTPKTGTDELSYDDIVVPGLANLTQVGAPRLPVARFDLGVVTGASIAYAGSEQAAEIAHVAIARVWPKPTTAQFHEGTPEQFVRDPAIYGSAGYWPPSVAPSATPVDTIAGYLGDASVAINPLRWDPSTGDLEVHRNSTFTIYHPGTAAFQEETTPHVAALLSHQLFNWPAVEPWVAVNQTKYLGDFLFICPARYSNAITPLENQKAMRGYGVTELLTEDIGSRCPQVLSAIRDWYVGTPKGHEHFCMLIGDTSDVSLCVSPLIFGYPEGVFTDDMYGSPVAKSLDKSVMIGRLMPVDAAELATEVARILAYEDKPPANGHYEDVILAAHRGIGGCCDIKDFQEDVRNAAYATPPNFITQYGADGAGNLGLQWAINTGCGILCYIGHGEVYQWIEWSGGAEDWTTPSVEGLANGPRTPVVWSLACRNGYLPVAGNLCAAFMHQGTNGAAAIYGATQNVEVDATAALDGYLFQEVYTRGNVVQGYTYFAAENAMEKNYREGDAWKFLLLGDPQMTIRRTSPPAITVSRPDIAYCGPACRLINLYASMPGGAPVAGARAAVWKPAPTGTGAGGFASELLDNRYTDTSGLAQIPAPTLTDGMLYYSLETDDGFAMRDSVRIVGGVVSVEAAAPAPTLRLTASPSLTRGPTRFSFGTPLSERTRLHVLDVSGREVRSLGVEAGTSVIEWDGRDGSGARVASGVYVAVVADGRIEGRARVVVVR